VPKDKLMTYRVDEEITKQLEALASRYKKTKSGVITKLLEEAYNRDIRNLKYKDKNKLTKEDLEWLEALPEFI